MMQNNIKIKIHYYKQPSFIHKVDYSKIIGDLWKSKISNDPDEDKQIKKTIANINFGLLEKSNNTRQRSRIFKSLREACHYQNIYGGKVIALTHSMKEYIDLDDECDIKSNEGETFYVLNVSDKTELVNGFRYIKELLLQYHNFKMFETYNLLTNNGIEVYSVKSDAFTIHEATLNAVRGMPTHLLRYLRQGILNFDNQIGNWRVSGKNINFPNEKYKYKNNQFIHVAVQENISIDVADEWDTQNICEQILECNPCMIRAKFAGSGKSYIGQHFNKMDKKVLFVVPHNRLSQEIQGDAITLNKFFSIPIDKEDRLPIFDHSEFDVIVFDEIYMSPLFILNKIREFVNNHPEKIIIGAGDCKQIPPIKDLTNVMTHEEYSDHCMDTIFKYNIFLKISKRVGGKDRAVLDNLYVDFWEKKLPIRDIIDKYFKYTDNVMTSDMHIAYTNLRCRSVAQRVRVLLGKKSKYETGEELICRLYLDKDGMKFNVNIRYKVINVKPSMITIQNIKDRTKTYTLHEDVIDKHFIYGYCATCHSCQGASIKSTITIHEWEKTNLVTREWLWTCITRATDFRNVYFFKNESEDDKMHGLLLRNYLKKKIDGYKVQDFKAGRSINADNYVDVKWCLDRMSGCCQKCGGNFEIDDKKGKLSSAFTVQRVDNAYCHSKDNCVAYCRYCNCSSK